MTTPYTRVSTGLQAGAEVGNYRVLKPLGAGGMGEVWLAEHVLLGRLAAIKVLHSNYSSREDIVMRFFNEARAATAIADPGIVQIFDFGHHTDGSAYIVMELLEGETLDARCRTRNLPVVDALRIMRQVAASLGAAHARGIVHRDLKPENIFLVRDAEVPGGERAKILDFGIAKLADPQRLTQTAEVMGTPAYMSPEQCRGAGQVDARSDVYSLGCVMFDITTGRGPFDADALGDFVVLHITQSPPRLGSRIPNLPPSVDELVARCLEKDPARRFNSGTELAAAIEQVLELPMVAIGSSLSEPGLGVKTTLSGSGAASFAVPKPRRRRHQIVGLVAVAAIATGFAAVTLTKSEVTPAIESPAVIPVERVHYEPPVQADVLQPVVPLDTLIASVETLVSRGIAEVEAVLARPVVPIHPPPRTRSMAMASSSPPRPTTSPPPIVHVPPPPAPPAVTPMDLDIHDHHNTQLPDTRF